MSQVKRADLTYDQRRLLGVITARSQFSQEARSRAMQFSQVGKDAESFIAHGEADQHDQVIIDAIFDIVKISTTCAEAEVSVQQTDEVKDDSVVDTVITKSADTVVQLRA